MTLKKGKNATKRIFCRCSSTIAGIAESTLMACCRLGKAVDCFVVSWLGQVAVVVVDMCSVPSFAVALGL